MIAGAVCTSAPLGPFTLPNPPYSRISRYNSSAETSRHTSAISSITVHTVQAERLVRTVGAGLTDSKLGCDMVSLLNLSLLEFTHDAADRPIGISPQNLGSA